MNHRKDNLKNGYIGLILDGPYSASTKKHVAKVLSQFIALDQVGCPAIPYVSAWHLNEQKIWYEFVGRQLYELMGCGPADTALSFSKNIIDRSVYRNPVISPNISKIVLSKTQIRQHRLILRSEIQKAGGNEAVYKVALPEGGCIWLKDQARVEIFNQDNICISKGVLTDITKEMKAEEQLKGMQKELKLHRDRLEGLVKDRTRKLWKSQLEVVQRLARAAEFRDEKTGTHITKMSHYCAILSKAAGLSKKNTALLYHSAPMHDVGKIGITDRILLKKDRLTQMEYELMKTHCKIGAQLLSGQNSSLMRVARTIAFTHHEKWDGSGYPRGLSKKTIPLAGRIAAVCDVFDALTSKRPYKKAWSFDQAVKEIHQQKGIHFDPQLVDIFVHNLPKIRAIATNKK